MAIDDAVVKVWCCKKVAQIIGLLLTINVKKLQFNHALTTIRIELPIENSKNDKKVILAT